VLTSVKVGTWGTSVSVGSGVDVEVGGVPVLVTVGDKVVGVLVFVLVVVGEALVVVGEGVTGVPV